MSCCRRALHYAFITLVAALFVIFLFAAVSEASENSEALNATFNPGNGASLKVNGVSQNSYQITGLQQGDVVEVPFKTFTLNVNDNDREYVFSKSGSTFKGWSANNTTYYCGQKYTMTGSNVTFTAVWENGSKIIFDPNGGVAKNNRTYSQDCSSPIYVPGSKFTYDGTDYEYTMEGYTFIGWSTNKYAETPEYVKGNMLQPDDTGYVLYAVWKINTNRVTFVYDETTSAEVDIEYGYSFDSGAYMNYTPLGKENYKIVGWTSIQMSDANKDLAGAYILDSNAVTYSKKIQLPAPEDITLYPIWALIVTESQATPTLTITDKSGCYYINRVAAANGIDVKGGSPYLYIDNVYVDFSNKGNSPFIIEKNGNNSASVTLIVMGDSYFKGANNVDANNGSNGDNLRKYSIGYAGINVQSGNTLTISEDSLGKLTAVGGDATGRYINNIGRWDSSNPDKNTIRARSGAGIGSNGAVSDDSYPYDSKCGTIIIKGGIVSASGGDAIVRIESYQDTQQERVRTVGIKSGAVAAQGIGGTTESTDRIQILGGSVTAATGHITGKKDGVTDKTYVILTSNNAKYVKPIFAGDGSDSRITKSNNAMITEVTRTGGTSNATTKATITFTSVKKDGSNVTIGNAESVTIDNEYTIDVGGMSISAGTTLEVDATKIGVNSSIVLVTKVGNYYTGTAQSNGGTNKYKIDPLSERNDSPHGTVEVYANEEQVNGAENFGSINPYQSFTIAGSGSVTRVTHTFTLDLNDGYTFTGIKIGSLNSTTGEVDWDSPHDGELVDQSGPDDNNVWSVTVKFTVSSVGAGTKNYVSFTIEKVKVEVTINNTYSERVEMTYPDGIVSPENLTDPAITWGTGNTTGTQFVPYKESMSYKICVLRASGGDNYAQNPFSIMWIKVNGEAVTFTQSAQRAWEYTFTVDDISSATTIEIRYAPTVRVIGHHPTYVGDYDNDYIQVQGTYVNGDTGWCNHSYEDSELGRCEISYVEKGSAAYFKIFDNRGSAQDAWTYNGGVLGVQLISITTGSNTYSMRDEVNHQYTVGVVYDDVHIYVRITAIRWDVSFISFTDEDPYEIEVVDGTYYDMPRKGQLTSIGLSDKVGYDLLGWNVKGYDLNGQLVEDYDCDPGDPILINSVKVFTAIWPDDDEPHPYAITYDVPEGTTINSPLTYTVLDRVELGDASHEGYDFVGWITEGQSASEASSTIVIPVGTIGDKHYIAVWNGLPVQVTLKDLNGVKDPITRTFTYGSPYSDLPIYSNYTSTSGSDNGTKYTFAGWGTDYDSQSQMVSGRITEDTVVSNAQSHEIYVIWIKSTLFIVNITNDGSYGGTVSANIYGLPGTDEIDLTISMYQGYIAKEIVVSSTIPADNQTISIHPTSNPYEYPITTSTPPAGTIWVYYSITVTFEEIDRIPIPKPTATSYIYDGTEKHGVSEGVGYIILSGNSGTNYGLYSARVQPTSEYIWEDGTDVAVDIPWQIYKRTAYIIAISTTMTYTGSEIIISSDQYVLLCVIPSDVGEGGSLTISSTGYTITGAGQYPNNVSVTDPNDNYEFIRIHGTFIVVKQDSSSITVEMSTHVNRSLNIVDSNIGAAEPGRMVANVPAVGRKVES